MSYSDKLKSPKWQKKRLEVLNRDNFTCCKCGDTETELQVHHLKYTGEPHEAPMEDLETLCKHCHYYITFIHADLRKNYPEEYGLGEVISISKLDGQLIAEYNFYMMLVTDLESKSPVLGFAFFKGSPVIKKLYDLSKTFNKNGKTTKK
jgi:hypothetical protein